MSNMFRAVHPTENQLASLSLFQGIPSRERRRVIQHFEPATVPAGTIVIHQDRSNRHTYFVLSGRLDVAVDGQHVASVGPDEVVGERTLLGPTVANATVTAGVDTEVLAVDHRALLALAADHPALAERLRGIDAQRSGRAAA